MKTILVINDNTTEAKHALEFASNIAKKAGAQIWLANTCKINIKLEKAMVRAIPENTDYVRLIETLNLYTKELDVSAMDENQLARIINENKVWMIVKGMAYQSSFATSDSSLNIHTILNKILCPALLIPARWVIKSIQRLVYIADLRYCRIEIVRYLASLAKPWLADLLIAHLSAKGLPDIEEKYATRIFNEEIFGKSGYDRLFFANIKEKDLSIAVDVIINGMHHDLLVLINHRFHFEEIIGKYSSSLPSHITVPLLIFPS
ncbi:MAG: hypothetical protein JWQ66_4195 [Mucilaginibacter sp.]|nr:hypothetical protein [Mucilaginibacter sp.]